jgi:hypothetical protein
MILLGEEYKLWSSSLCSFLQPTVTSSLFGPNILLNTLFSNTLSLCSSLNIRDQVRHPYKTTVQMSFIFVNQWLYSPLLGPYLICSFVIIFIQSVGLLGWVISPSQGLYLNTWHHKHRINAYTDIYALNGIRTHDPSVRASEDSSCLRPRGHCDQRTDVHKFKSSLKREMTMPAICRFETGSCCLYSFDIWRQWKEASSVMS